MALTSEQYLNSLSNEDQIMHELSIAVSIVDIAINQAELSNAEKINEVELEIGQLAGIEMESLNFCFESVCKETIADGAKLSIDEVEALGECDDCNRRFPVDNYFAICPDCDGTKVDIVQGKELKIKAIIVD